MCYNIYNEKMKAKHDTGEPKEITDHEKRYHHRS